MTVTCKKCGRTFKNRKGLDQHNRRKTPCDVKHQCEKCHVEFQNASLLKRHLKRKTPCAPEEVPVIVGNNDENRCQFCNRTFSSKSNLKRHQRDNCNKQNNMQVMIQMIQNLTEQNRRLEEKMDKQLAVPNQTVNIDNRSVNIINFVNFPIQDMTTIDMKPVLRILNDQPKRQIVPSLVEYLHGNPKYPEHQNIYMDEIGSEVTIVYGESEKSPNKKTWYSMPTDQAITQLKDEAMGLVRHPRRPIVKMELLELASAEGIQGAKYQENVTEMTLEDMNDEAIAEKLVSFKALHLNRQANK